MMHLPFFFLSDFCLEMGPYFIFTASTGEEDPQGFERNKCRTYMCAIFVGFGQFGNTTEGSALRSSINPPYVLGPYKYAD